MDKEIDDYSRDFTPERWYRQTICVNKKEEKNSLALRIVLIHQYKDARNSLKEQTLIAAASKWNTGRNWKISKTWKQEWEERQLYGDFKQQAWIHMRRLWHH